MLRSSRAGRMQAARFHLSAAESSSSSKAPHYHSDLSVRGAQHLVKAARQSTLSSPMQTERDMSLAAGEALEVYGPSMHRENGIYLQKSLADGDEGAQGESSYSLRQTHRDGLVPLATHRQYSTSSSRQSNTNSDSFALESSRSFSQREHGVQDTMQGDRQTPSFDDPSPASSEHSRMTDFSSPPSTHTPSRAHSDVSQSGDIGDGGTKVTASSRRIAGKQKATYQDVDDLTPSRAFPGISDVESAHAPSSRSIKSRGLEDADTSNAVTIWKRGSDNAPVGLDKDDSLIATRARRSSRKSLKQIEAEESESLSPRRRKRAASSSSALHPLNRTVPPVAIEGKARQTRKSEGIAPSDFTSQMRHSRKRLSLPSKTSEAPPMTRAPSTRQSVQQAAIHDSEGKRFIESPAQSECGASATIRPSIRKMKPSATSNLLTRSARKNTIASSSTSRQESIPIFDISNDSSNDSCFSRHTVAAKDEDSNTKSTPIRDSRPTSWKRKTFLSSGLYSDDHKFADTPDAAAGREKRNISRALTTRKGPLLPLPADYGYWMLVEKRDFRLPYPIHREIDDIRTKVATRRKPPPYKHISTNRYVSRPKLPGEIMVCQCPPDGNCGDSCVNRQTEYLCHPKHCPCGDKCTNIQFGKRQPVKTEVKWYGPRGFGLRTNEPIAKGSFIDEYRGEVISYNEMVRRVRDHYKHQGNYYFLMYDAPAGEMLDGGLKGNITRFANHSCDPNCKIQKWLVCGTDEARAGEFQVALFAARDIAPGEELTYDYGWSAFSPKSVAEDGSTNTAEICHCGAANCSGFMGVKKAAVFPKASESKTSVANVRRKKRNYRPRKAAATEETATAALLAAARAARSPSDDSHQTQQTAQQDVIRTSVSKRKHRHIALKTAKPALGKSLARQKVFGRESVQIGTKNKAMATPRRANVAESRVQSSKRQNSSTKLSSGRDSQARLPSPAKNAENKRVPVKDRTIYAWVPTHLPKEIDSENVPIMNGKRQRQPSTYAESSASSSPMPERDPRRIVKRRRTETAIVETSEPRVSSAAPSQDDTAMTGLAMAADGDLPFDMAKHPPGTQFFARSGKLFDFSRLEEKKRGQRPRVYTLEELRYAQDRHRASVAKANRRRRANLKANRTI